MILRHRLSLLTVTLVYNKLVQLLQSYIPLFRKKWHVFHKEAEPLQMSKNLNSLIYGRSDVPKLLEPMAIRQLWITL